MSTTVFFSNFFSFDCIWFLFGFRSVGRPWPFFHIWPIWFRQLEREWTLLFCFLFCFVFKFGPRQRDKKKHVCGSSFSRKTKNPERLVFTSFFFYRVLPSFTLSGAEVLPSFFIFFPGLVHFDGETSLSIPKAMERIFPKKINVIFYDANEKSVFTEFYLVLLNLVVFFFWSRPLWWWDQSLNFKGNGTDFWKMSTLFFLIPKKNQFLPSFTEFFIFFLGLAHFGGKTSLSIPKVMQSN